MEGFSAPKIKTKPEDEPTKVLNHGEKTINAQEVLVPVYDERLDPKSVLDHMFTKNKYSFGDKEERRFLIN